MADHMVKGMRSADSADSGAPEKAGGKKPYTSPVLEVWGPLAEVTKAVGTSGHKDGGRKPYNRTH